MAITGNGTSDKIVANAAVSAASVATVSMSFWYRNASAPGTAAIRSPCAIADATGNAYFFGFHWSHTTAGFTQAIRAVESGGTFRTAQIVTSLSGNTWYHILGTYDATNIKVYLNGGLEATTACAAFGTGTDPTMSALSKNAGTLGFDDGTIAEPAWWNTALSLADAAQLALGVSPLLIRADKLIAYWPLIRAVFASVGGAITSTGTTVADHPLVIYPVGRQSNYLTDVYDTSPQSVFSEDDFSISEGGANTDVGDTITASDESGTGGMGYGQTSDSIIVSERSESDNGYLATSRAGDSVGTRIP